MGWNPAEVWRDQFLILSTHGGLRDAGRKADRARLSHRPLGDRPAGARRGRGTARRLASCRSRRTVSDPCDGRTQGTTGHVRQPAVPQRRGDHDAAADPLAAAPVRRHGHRDVRQGSARDDAGAGRLRRSAGHHRARRRHAAGGGRRGRRQGADRSAPGSRTASSPRGRGRRWAAARAARPAAAASSWARRRRRRSSPRRSA